MRAAVHQPNYLPWPGFFRKMAQCDVFVLLDNVQYPRREYCNRAKVRSPQGAFWLTLPVEKAGLDAKISEVRISEPEKNLARHLKTLRYFYGRAPFYDVLENRLGPLYEKTWDRLLPLNTALIEVLAGILGITTPVVLASCLGEPAGGKSERIIGICRKVGADTYLSGRGAEAYNDALLYAEAGITLEYQVYEPPVYPQGGKEYISGLSVVDLLAYHGPAGRRYLQI